ncbi:MAG: hypothetical protein MRY74_09125 [Neomegalonema sp.]|nr:hypothetical protein [Neomegalonema sp.]
MSKQVYRGVEFDSEEKPKNDHHHEDGLRYRGAELNGEEAEKEAQAISAGHNKVYRGVEQKDDE